METWCYYAGVTRLAWVFALVILTAPARAEDAQLAAIRHTALSMRGRTVSDPGTRGATPELTVLKHQIRDWIESRLGELKPGGDAEVLAKELSQTLRDAKLSCSPSLEDCPEDNFLGFLGPVRLFWQSRFLVVETGVGILCGFDESAYVYEWLFDRWQRRLESEQNVYTGNQYVPQMIDATLISPSDADKSNLALILGSRPWCSSNWHDVDYRLWRIGPRDQMPKLLLQDTAFAFLSSSGVQGAVAPDDALIEFTVGSIDPGTFAHETIRHFKVHGDKVERVDPIVLSPRDFVDEWLSNSWTESAAWSEPAFRATLQPWHQKYKAGKLYTEFIEPAMHCPKSPDLWQVGMNFSPLENGPGKESSEYFVVRWRPPYHFTMVEVSEHSKPGCTEEDKEADEPRTLFLH